MVKGISRQVILVQSPEPKLFEQAIFILRDGCLKEGVTDELLLKEAQKVIRDAPTRRLRPLLFGAFWAASGALVTGAAWLLWALL